MILLLSFLVCGLFCLAAQIILDNTNLTAGHITTLFTILGSVLSFFNIYDFLIKKCGAGANILISNFGAALYNGAISGYQKEGIIGLFTGLLSNSSAAISSAIIFAFICTLLFKPKD